MSSVTRTRREELERLADEVVPILLSRLADSRLGELEVRGGDWRVRVRRTSSASPRSGPSSSGRGRDRASRGSAGKASISVSRDVHALASQLGTPSANGETGTPQAGGGDAGRRADTETGRVVVRAPAVGYFLPPDALATGQLVGRDDVLGHVDVLGVRQDVVAPRQGIVSRLFVEPGQAVEYGQELLQIDAVHRAEEPARRAAAVRGGGEPG
jgi:biotin carboxyl carrier protein